MLEPWLIEEIRKQKKPVVEERPQLPIPLPPEEDPKRKHIDPDRQVW